MNPNAYGCRKSEDVCVMHDELLVCDHGCREVRAHDCATYKQWRTAMDTACGVWKKFVGPCMNKRGECREHANQGATS